MRALRLHGAGDLRLEDEPPPVPGPGDAVVRVTAVGICGSDLHWYDEAAIGGAMLTRPLVLGHEAAGVIADGPRAGQRVALDPQVPCTECETCAAGRGHLCPNVRFLGHSNTDGALRELIAWPLLNLVPLPDTIDDPAGSLLEPLGVALHAVRLARIRPGDAVAVLGCGPIGLLLIQLARSAGATTVVATDRLPHRVDVARRLGAIAMVVDGGAERDVLRQATGGRGVDAAIEIAGNDDAIQTAIALSRPAGTVVVAGIPDGDYSTITASIARRKGLDLRFSRRMVHTYRQAIDIVEAGLVDLSVLVSHQFELADYDAAFRTAVRREGLKVIVRPS
ncbi:MAG: zinc-dependent alcohol dehydrogenase [Aeromicrobium sp.]